MVREFGKLVLAVQHDNEDIFNTNNSINIIYTQFNDQTVLFQIIQSSISHLFVLILNIKHFYLTHRWWGYQVLPLWARVDQRTIVMKGYSINRASLSDCLSFSGHSCSGVLTLCIEAVSVFYNPRRLTSKIDLKIQ